jgi:hypothetical protein
LKTFFDSPLRVALLCAVLIVTWWCLTVDFNYGGNWTGLFCTGDIIPVPEPLKAGTYIFHNSAGFDGQFYRYIAHDPLLQHSRASIDDIPVRQRRILLPLLAYVLAAGRQSLIDWTYMGIVLFGIVAGVYITALFAQRHGYHALWGAAFLIIPGTLTSIDRMLLDGPFAALAAAFAYAVANRRPRMLWLVLLFAPLTRETGFLFTAAVCATELWHRRFQSVLLYGVTAVPALAWSAYVNLHAPRSTASQIMARPFYGLVLRIFEWPAIKAVRWVAVTVGAAEAIAMAAFITSLLLTIWLCVRAKPGPLELAGLLFAVAAFLLGERFYVTESFGYARPISPLFVFLLFRFFTDRLRLALVLIAAVSLPIGAYFAYQALGILSGVKNGIQRFAS